MPCSHGCCETNRDHWLSVGISAAATPTRTSGARVAAATSRESRLASDLDAYKRLRQDGLQPLSQVGAHRLEHAAECAEHVETARFRYGGDGTLESANSMLNVKARSFEVFREETGVRVTDPQTSPVESQA